MLQNYKRGACEFQIISVTLCIIHYTNTRNKAFVIQKLDRQLNSLVFELIDNPHVFYLF